MNENYQSSLLSPRGTYPRDCERCRLRGRPKLQAAGHRCSGYLSRRQSRTNTEQSLASPNAQQSGQSTAAAAQAIRAAVFPISGRREVVGSLPGPATAIADSYRAQEQLRRAHRGYASPSGAGASWHHAREPASNAERGRQHHVACRVRSLDRFLPTNSRRDRSRLPPRGTSTSGANIGARPKPRGRTCWRTSGRRKKLFRRWSRILLPLTFSCGSTISNWRSPIARSVRVAIRSS